VNHKSSNMYIKFVKIVLIILFFNTISYTQNKAHVKGGLLLVSLSNDDFSFRPGYNLGIQGKIGAPGIYMSPGLFYQKFTISEYNKKKYINNRPSYSLIKINTDGGYEGRFTDLIRYRVFAGVNLNYILSIDNNEKNINFNNIHDAFVGYDLGFG